MVQCFPLRRQLGNKYFKVFKLLGSIITFKSAGDLLKSLDFFTVTRASEGSFAPLSCYYHSFFNIKQIYKPSNDLKREQLLLGSTSIHEIGVIRMTQVPDFLWKLSIATDLPDNSTRSIMETNLALSGKLKAKSDFNFSLDNKKNSHFLSLTWQVRAKNMDIHYKWQVEHIFCTPFSRRIDSSTVFQLFT